MSDQLKEEGLALFRQGKREEALTKFEEAAASYEASDNPIGRAEVLNNIGVIERVEGEWAASSSAFKAAEQIFATEGDRNRQAQVLGNLGDLHAYKGEQEVAAGYYSAGIELFAEDGDREKQAMLLRALSLLRLRQRRMVEAIYLMEQSLAVRPHLNVLQRLFLALVRFSMRLFGGP